MDNFKELTDKLAETLHNKNMAYGNSFTVTRYLLGILYPSGIEPYQYKDIGLVVRILDKIKRIATANDPYNEDAWMDIAGYGILGAAHDKDDKQGVNESYPG